MPYIHEYTEAEKRHNQYLRVPIPVREVLSDLSEHEVTSWFFSNSIDGVSLLDLWKTTSGALKVMDAARKLVAPSYPWFPEEKPDEMYGYEKQYVRDNKGTIWLIVRDGGMVTTADYSGQIWSAGLKWLEQEHGPLERVYGLDTERK